jgi:hypothetical protein
VWKWKQQGPPKPRGHDPEDHDLIPHRCEDLTSHNFLTHLLDQPFTITSAFTPLRQKSSKGFTIQTHFYQTVTVTLNTSCGYKFPGMYLMHDLKGAMRLDHSKDIHVCACFNLHQL